MAKYSDITSISKSSRKNDVAVVIHLFYEDLFEGLASYLDNFENQADFFFNVRENALVRMKAIIKQRYPDAEIVAYPNQGRDVLPFLYMLPYLLKLDYKAVCKIHSKKSKHREDGDNWRDDVLSKLLGSKAIISACFAQISSGAGIVAPSGHLLDGSHYWGSNANRVTELAIRMGCPQKSVDNFYFPAGNMFWFSPKAIKSLLSLNLTAMDFENEAGQVDGTTAHAIERLIGLAALKHGFRVEETAEQVSAQTQEYAYAEKTIPKK
jgi:lipopolysaccharide biosynthesis protein